MKQIATLQLLYRTYMIWYGKRFVNKNAAV